MEHVQFAHAATAVLILSGLCTVAYFQSSMTAILVQGLIGERFRLRRMQKRIDGLSNHVIVTGAVATGMHVVVEIYATKTVFVVIDKSRETLERISRDLVGGELLYIVGDATDDGILIQAG